MSRAKAPVDVLELTAVIDNAAVLQALDRLGPIAERHVKAAAHETANAIVREASARLRRQLSSAATGATEAGIRAQESRDGRAWLVISARAPLPNLPLWLEKGTRRGLRPRAYFYSAGELEAGAHQRRVEAALEAALGEAGW